MSSAHEQVMEKFDDREHSAVAPATGEAAHTRRTRNLRIGGALTVAGFILGAIHIGTNNTSWNGLFFAVLFTLAGGGWLLFDAYLDHFQKDDTR